jgi:hypothetical protein
VKELAYRFVPIGDNDATRNEPPLDLATRQSRYTLLTTRELRVGEQIQQAMLGYEIWEVVKLLPAPGPLQRTRDDSGAEIVPAGTAICRGLEVGR